MADGSTSFKSFMAGTVDLSRWRLFGIFFLVYLGVNSATALAHASSVREVLLVLQSNLAWAVITPLLMFWVDWAIKGRRGTQIALCLITFIVLCVISEAISKNLPSPTPANDHTPMSTRH